MRPVVTTSISIIGVCLMAYATIWLIPPRGKQFDSQKWKRIGDQSNAGVLAETRNEMGEDIIRRKLLEGKSREMVHQMLGTVTPMDKFKSDCDSIYWLGPQSTFIPIDSEWLCLRYDDGRVSMVKLVRD